MRADMISGLRGLFRSADATPPGENASGAAGACRSGGALDRRILARLQEEAEDVARHEPEIAGYIFSAVVKHDSLASVVIQRLAARLGHADVPGDVLRQTFSRLSAEDSSISDAFVADLIAIVDRDPACRRFLEPILYFKGFHAIQTHRFAHVLWHQGRRELARYLQSRSSSIFQVDIHPRARIGRGVLLDHATGLVIAADAVVEDDVSILHNVAIGVGEIGGASVVRRGASLGAGSKVVEGVTIGACVRVAAGSVVTKSVAANQTVAGSPARVVSVASCGDVTRTFEELLATKLEIAHDKSVPHIL